MSEDFINQLALVSTYYEQTQEAVYIPSKDKNVMHRNIFDVIREIFIPYKKETAEARETQDKLIKNLSLYTDSKAIAIKELDFVRTQVDHLAMEYGQIAAAYVDLYKRAKSVNLSEIELHNLLISTTLAGYREGLSEEDIADILTKMSELLQDKFVTIDEFNKLIGYKFQHANSWTKEAPKKFNKSYADGSVLFDTIMFLDMFSDYVMKTTMEVKPEEFNPDYVKANYYENRMYDKNLNHEQHKEFVDDASPILKKTNKFLGQLGKIFPAINGVARRFLFLLFAFEGISDIIDWHTTNKHIEGHYQNSNDFRYIPQTGKFIEYQKDKILLKGGVQEYNYYENSDYDMFYDDYKENEFQDLEYSSSLNTNLPISENIIDTETLSSIQNPHYTDLEVEVKRILANTIDDFAQLKGFSVKKT